MSTIIKKTHEFYGYRMIQNPSNQKLALYVCGVDAQVLRHIVSVDNAVKWDSSSNIWKSGGRNRTVDDPHWQSIKDFLASSNLERILPSAIVISVEDQAFNFEPFIGMAEIAHVTPGMVKVTGHYVSDPDNPGSVLPAAEQDRSAWVLDGQHRIMAFRNWSMPDPYPVNVIIIKAWVGGDYEDVMRHQTYELNMGRPLSDDFKAAVREQYDAQIGHTEYKQQIALSWIRKDLEKRGAVFSPKGIVGASKLRTPYVITMSFLESLIRLAYDHDPYLKGKFTLEKMDKQEVAEFGKYLYDFFEGVRLSIGLINPNTKGTIGSEPAVNAAADYWDIAAKTDHKQRLLHNVGLKALVRGLLHAVMRGSAMPKNPQEVATLLDHMRGIPWHENQLQSKKDDWVVPLANALNKMYNSAGTRGGKNYQLILQKTDKKTGNVIDTYNLQAFGWKTP
jgi:hypothetical protein